MFTVIKTVDYFLCVKIVWILGNYFIYQVDKILVMASVTQLVHKDLLTFAK